jgi:hypothetical protein
MRTIGPDHITTEESAQHDASITKGDHQARRQLRRFRRRDGRSCLSDEKARCMDEPPDGYHGCHGDEQAGECIGQGVHNDHREQEYPRRQQDVPA